MPRPGTVTTGDIAAHRGHDQRLLEVRDLVVAYGTSPVVRGVSFDIKPGEMLGIVGESGSGKTTAVLAAVGLAPTAATVTAGSSTFDGHDLTRAPRRHLRSVLGSRIGIVYQDPLRSLNPVMRVGAQVGEVFEAHRRRQVTDDDVAQVLRDVGIPDPASRLRAYPHEFSGGMRQRALIGMALALSPSLVVADEPTTAVDVTVQAQILDLLDRLATQHGAGAVIVSHDLGVISRMCQRVAVMYAGRVVETGPTDDVFAQPHHPYTQALLAATPDVSRPRRGPLSYIAGRPPEASEILQRCQFAPRCEFAEPDCESMEPELAQTAQAHESACLIVQQGGVEAIRAQTEQTVPPRRRAETDTLLLRASGLRRVYESNELRSSTRR